MESINTLAKIKCLLEMALKSDISWLTLQSIINELTPTLEKSKEINKALLKEFENHQSICLIQRSDDNDAISEDVFEIDANQSIADSFITIQGQDSDEDVIQTLDERKSSKTLSNTKSNDIISEDKEYDSSNVNEHDNYISNFSEAEPRIEELCEENNVSKNIQLVETYKGQLYTFIGDESEENSATDSYNEVLDSDNDFDFEHSKNEEDIIKIRKEMSSRKSYECETCGKCFRNNFHLNTHIRTHTGEKPFLCKTCKKGFTQESNLKMHERNHTGEIPYQCNYCKKGFIYFSNLKNHERAHTGEKPYRCKKCSENFSYANSLTIHERTHTGEKPFQCKTCEKSFINASGAKRHERTHTSEQPVTCKTCGKSFTQSHNLKKHEKVHMIT